MNHLSKAAPPPSGVRYVNLTPNPVRLSRPGGVLVLPRCGSADVPYVALEYGPGQSGPEGVTWCEARPWVHLLPEPDPEVVLIVPTDVALLASLAGRQDVRTPWLGRLTPTTHALARLDLWPEEVVNLSPDPGSPLTVRVAGDPSGHDAPWVGHNAPWVTNPDAAPTPDAVPTPDRRETVQEKQSREAEDNRLGQELRAGAPVAGDVV